MKRTLVISDFDRLYAEYGAPVFRFCHRLTGNRQEAEDLTQDVFVAAFSGSQSFRGEADVKTWLFRIAYYKCRESNRRRRQEQKHQSSVNVDDRQTESLLVIEQALAELPEKLKVCFALVKLEELTSAEAAKILRIPEGTVKYRVYQAIHSLRRSLESTPETQTTENPYAL